MDPIYDRNGRTVGWLYNGAVLDLLSRPRAFVQGTEVFSAVGRYLGTFHDGFFRDARGGAVSWIEGAQHGPTTLVHQVPPVPPVPPVLPVSPVLPIPPVPATPSSTWGLSWAEFLLD